MPQPLSSPFWYPHLFNACSCSACFIRQCKEYGLVDRLATSWDILGELAAEGRDVILVKRKEPQNKSSLLALFDRASEAAHDLAAIFKTYSPLGKTGSADPTDRFQALSTSPTERSARL